ncbi:hypothetical protein WMY93_014029 [Mugilogobius chulae]|uniref:Uncharacterized protein n=1 Tax=Mugilogobius chulae TaxID=88201 RepID=A0AAW0NXL6_9GOBI
MFAAAAEHTKRCLATVCNINSSDPKTPRVPSQQSCSSSLGFCAHVHRCPAGGSTLPVYAESWTGTGSPGPYALRIRVAARGRKRSPRTPPDQHRQFGAVLPVYRQHGTVFNRIRAVWESSVRSFFRLVLHNVGRPSSACMTALTDSGDDYFEDFYYFPYCSVTDVTDEDECVEKFREKAVENLQLSLFYSSKQDVFKAAFPLFDEGPAEFQLASECFWLGCVMALHTPPLHPDWDRAEEETVFPRSITADRRLQHSD